jgi:cell fate regulator YaaT (PSP1 superfamily)
MERKLAIKLRKFNRICPITGYKDEAIKVGAAVIVQTDRGEEYGTIISFPKKYPKVVAQDVRLKKVLRYATSEDLKIISGLEEKEAGALQVASQKAAEYELKIKIVDAEYLFDTKKVSIYYKVEKDKSTPDLKAYRKDLSITLSAEITMRAVTPRDEAKLCGGLGPCGRPLCCAVWLSKPRHITVKMVKDQGFQISPLRTSGMCGRLMCCFEYEQEGGQA